MRQRLIYLLYTVLLCLFFSGDAIATSTTSHTNPAAAAKWCFGLIGMSGSSTGSGGVNGEQGIIAPLIECFADSTQGIIPQVTKNFIAKTQSQYLSLIATMFLLAIAFYGVRIFTGDIKRLKSETIIFGLKIAGIALFVNSAASIYGHMLDIMNQLSNDISSVAKSVHNTGFCIGGGASASNPISTASTSTTAIATNDLWQRWDCIFSYLLGFSKTGFAAASIASFLLLMFFSLSNGILVMVLGLYVILRLLSGAFRFIHIYLMSVLSLSFLFCLGYIFVPMLLFKNTFQYFKQWLTIMFGFILTPVIMFGFMGMMLVALDIALFSGQYSVFCAIGGSSKCGTFTSGGASIFADLTTNVDSKAEKGSGNPNLQNNFKSLILVALNDLPSLNTASGSGAPDMVPLWCGMTGWCGQMTGITGKKFDDTAHPAAARVGFDQTTLNLSNMATAIGSTCTLNGSLGSGGQLGAGAFYGSCPYVENILISMLVAGLLVYIMVALLNYVPALATNLTGDAFGKDLGGSAINILKTVAGEKGGAGLLNIFKGSALGAADSIGGGAGAASATGEGFSKGVRAIEGILAGDRD